MEISVIIPTYNGAKKIEKLLRSLIDQSFSSFQLVIVIDGSTDETRAMIDNYQSHFRDLLIIEQGNGGRSAAKNRGVQNAKGDLLIFYDDDVIVSKSSIQNHFNFHSKNAEVILGGVPMEYPHTENTDIQNYKAFLTQKWLNKYPPGISRLHPDNLFLSSANFSIKRREFKRLSGFDENLRDAEDYDLVRRASGVGLSVFLDRDNIVVHHDPITCKSYILRLREYQEAHKQLQARASESKERKGNKWILKKLVYQFFSFSIWVRMVDSGWFMFLPNRIKYKFYDIIIQALSIENSHIPLH